MISFDGDDTSTGFNSVANNQTTPFASRFYEYSQAYKSAKEKAREYLKKVIFEIVKANGGEPILFDSEEIYDYADSGGPIYQMDFTGEIPDDSAEMFGIGVQKGEPRVFIKWGAGDAKYDPSAVYKVPGPDEDGPVESWGLDEIYEPDDVFELLTYNREYLRGKYGIELMMEE